MKILKLIYRMNVSVANKDFFCFWKIVFNLIENLWKAKKKFLKFYSEHVFVGIKI